MNSLENDCIYLRKSRADREAEARGEGETLARHERILLDLAEHRGVGYTPIKDVAARQSISLKYVEKLMPALKNAGLLDSSHGIGGGYRLNRDPEQYDLWEILRVTEGELAPVSCLQTDASHCQRAGECRTLSVWQGYYDLTRKYFSGITLADLMAVPQGDNYVI